MDLAPRSPEAEMLAAHDAVTTNSRKARLNLGTIENQGRHAAHTVSLEERPETAGSPRSGDRKGGQRPKASQRLAAGVYGEQEMRSGEANRLTPCSTRSRVRGDEKAVHEDRGGNQVPLLR